MSWVSALTSHLRDHPVWSPSSTSNRVASFRGSGFEPWHRRPSQRNIILNSIRRWYSSKDMRCFQADQLLLDRDCGSVPSVEAAALRFKAPRPALGSMPETRAVNVADNAVRSENSLASFIPPSPLRPLSFIHCHHSFSSRSQTCLPSVIFSFSILTLSCLTVERMMKWGKKHTNTGWVWHWWRQCNHIFYVFMDFLSFILCITDNFFYAFWETYIVHVLQIIVLSNKM